MRTLTYPKQDYDYLTYFTLAGYGPEAFCLFPDYGGVIRADCCSYDVAERDHIDALKPVTDGEWVLIDGKEYVTVISGSVDEPAEYPATFLLANTMPVIVMDGHGRLLIDGHILRFADKVFFDEDVEKEGGRWRLCYALRTAQLEGHIPAHCEHVLDDSGCYYKIHKAE